MGKLFCGLVIFAVLGSLSECRVAKDRRLDELDRADPQAALDDPRGGLGAKGRPGKMRTKIVRPDNEGYMRASCELLPANDISGTTGHILLKEKPGSPMEMYLNLFGLSGSVPAYKVQVYSSGAIMDGCKNAGVPFNIGRYDGHLADVSSDVIDNGEVQLAILDPSATLLGKKSIFGRSVQIIPVGSDEPAACCIVVHEDAKDMIDDVRTAKFSQPIEISGGDLDLDEEGWSNLMDQIFKEAEKNGVDPHSITNLINLSGPDSQGQLEELLKQENVNIDMDAIYAEAEKHGIDPESISNVVEIGEMAGAIPYNENQGIVEDTGSNIMDAVIREAEKQGVDPNSITKIVEIDKSEMTNQEGGNVAVPGNTNANLMDAVIEEAKRQGVDPSTITQIVDLGESADDGDDEDMDDMDENLREAVMEAARKQGIDPSTITKIKSLGEASGNIVVNGENVGAQGNIDSSIMEQVYEEARKEGVDPSTISEIIELKEDSEGHLVMPSGAEHNKAVDLDSIIKEAKRRGIDSNTIAKIVELKESADGLSMPDGSMANVNDVVDTNMPQSMLDAVRKAAEENNIPLDTITKIIDISEDPSEADFEAFQKAGLNLVGKSKMSSEDFEILKSAPELQSQMGVGIESIIPLDETNELGDNANNEFNEGEGDEMADVRPITDGVDR